jgi:predicted RNA-binding protein (virulence factor B family)
MVKIGKPCTLEVVKFADQGAYLDGGPYGEILLPNRYVPAKCEEGDEVEVFVHFDSEDRIVASTDFPKVMVDQFGYLRVVEVTSYGAFLDWGLPKDLFVPFREQTIKMEKDKSYLVRLYVDRITGRIVGTAKYKKYLNLTDVDFFVGDEVELIIANRTDLGYNAIINEAHLGILYFNEIFKPIGTGDRIKGFIKKIREDGKIDLSLEKQGYEKVDPVSDELLNKLGNAKGKFLPYSDKTDPEAIKEGLGISKKTFKKAIGLLYKQKLIAIEEDGIRLITE